MVVFSFFFCVLPLCVDGSNRSCCTVLRVHGVLVMELLTAYGEASQGSSTRLRKRRGEGRERETRQAAGHVRLALCFAFCRVFRDDGHYTVRAMLS